MSDTFVTLHGWVGSEVTYRDPQGISVVNFRVASTPRLKKEGKWVDGDTTWYSVTAWRHLATNIRDSVRKGDAVVVHGRLRTESWRREDGQLSNSLRIEASLVGHDLSRGTSTFLRTPRPDRAESEVDREVEAMMREADESAETHPFDSWGNPTGDGAQQEAGSDAA
jgi:single-strand DNA-binding protein